MSAPRLRRVTLFAAAALALSFVAGCAGLQQGIEALDSGTKKVNKVKNSTAVKTAVKLRSSFAEITEEEEYYIGRSVAALILSRYPAANAPAFVDYMNVLGTAVAYNSTRPETYAGYHFLLLDSDEVNAMAAPGGFVFVTRGLVRRCKDEETFAAVLAHEIGHVAAKHGLASIKKSRLMDAFQLLGTEAAKAYGPKELGQLTTVFEGALGDIMDTVVERGYDRKYEYEADDLGLKFAVRTGYNPEGLEAFLQSLAKESAGAAGAKGWFKTHPSAADRLARVKAEADGMGKLPAVASVRTQRFQAVKKGL